MNSKSIAHLAIHETVATLRYICCHADHPIFPIWMLWYFSQVKIRAYDEKGFTTLLQIDPQWDLSGLAWQQTFKLNWKAKNSTCLLFQFLPSAIFCIMFSLSLNSESIFELSNFFCRAHSSISFLNNFSYLSAIEKNNACRFKSRFKIITRGQHSTEVAFLLPTQ